MTLFQLLHEGVERLQSAENPDAEMDARQLLLAAFHLDTVHFLLNRMQELPEEEASYTSIERYRKMVEARRGRCPLQQILGSQEFMGLEFYINRHVLIPRQDTETLVELVLEEQQNREAAVLDLCTGTGCIAISLAVKGGYHKVAAADISEEALKVARRNVEMHGCGEQIRLYQGDLFHALEPGMRFDIITSNPPYIPTAVIRTLEPEVRDHEPVLALDGTEDGLLYYRRIASEAGQYLAEGGSIYLEIGHDQGAAVRALLEAAGYREIRVCKDLAANDRVVCARR